MFKEEKVLGMKADAKERVRELLVRYKYKTERRSRRNVSRQEEGQCWSGQSS